MIFGGALGLKPFKFLEIVGEIIGHNKMDLQGLPIGTTIESNGGIKIHSGRHIALNFGGGGTFVRSVGTPDYRATFSVVVAPDLDPNVRDPDQDGIHLFWMNAQELLKMLISFKMMMVVLIMTTIKTD